MDWNRRRVLSIVGGASLTALAGCSNDGESSDDDGESGTASTVGPEEAMRRFFTAIRNNDPETVDRYSFEDMSDIKPEDLADSNPPELVVVEEYSVEELRQQSDLNADGFEEYVADLEVLVEERDAVDDFTFVYTEYADPDYFEHGDYLAMVRKEGIWVVLDA